MPIRIVRLGTARARGEGVRIGTVRRPPRGVPKSDYSSGNWYDVWLPILAPTPGTVKMGRSAQTPGELKAFARHYRAEMARPENQRVIELLVHLSRTSRFSVGCYCADESRCHRSILRELLREGGAAIR